MGGVFGDWGEGMLGVSVPVWVGGGVDGRGVVSVGVRVCEPECAFVWVRAHLCLVCVFLFSLWWSGREGVLAYVYGIARLPCFSSPLLSLLGPGKVLVDVGVSRGG